MTDIELLQKEFDYYLHNKDSFLKQYNNKYIVLQSNKVIHVADTREAAISCMLEHEYKLGTFLVQHVDKDDDAIQRYHSRVYCYR